MTRSHSATSCGRAPSPPLGNQDRLEARRAASTPSPLTHHEYKFRRCLVVGATPPKHAHKTAHVCLMKSTQVRADFAGDGVAQQGIDEAAAARPRHHVLTIGRSISSFRPSAR